MKDKHSENVTKKQFEGELLHIEPYRLINKTENDPLANFFLTLAVIYNDLKGLIIFQRMLEDNYEKPTNTEPSVHAGEYAGILVQVNKLLIGQIHEFFEFLKDSEKTFLSSEFLDLLKKTNNKAVINEWNIMVNIALSKEASQDKFTSNLVQIRNNVSFHYHSGKELAKAFCTYFYNREKILKNELAYYSIAENMEKSRFFYADAAIEEYIRTKINGAPNTQNDSVTSIEFNKEMMVILQNTSVLIHRLLKVYLKNRPK